VPGVPLASAFVRVAPQTDTRAFEKDAAVAGAAAGKSYADGFYRDSNGRLRQANGKFATDAQKQMFDGGRKAGAGFGKSFSDTGGGVIRKGFTKLKGELGPLLIPIGIGGAIAAIGKIGIEYENNLNIFQAVTKATGGQMDIVAAKARALGADVQLPGVSAAGAAAAMTELSKAGFTVQQSMDAARGTLQLARIAHIDEAKAAEIAANAVNAFGIKASDVNMVVDELAATANSSSVEISDVSAAFKMAASVFSAFQGPTVGSKEAITELNTAIAILGNNGIKGSDAGTSLKQMLLQLTGPTNQAKDLMAELALRANGANISLEEQDAVLHGSKKIREEALESIAKHNAALGDVGDIAFDAAGKMRPLNQIIDLVTRGTKGMTDEERTFAVTQIFGADASRSVIALMRGGLGTYEKQRTAVLQAGSAAAVAAAQNKGLGGAIDNVKSQFENMAIAIYNQVKGPLTSGLTAVANLLSPVAGGIEKFGTFVQRNGGTIRDWAVAIGAVTLALKLNSVMLAVQGAGGLLAYVKTVRIVTTTTRLWAGGQALLNATLLANPIGLVIVALTALVAGVILAYRHSETFRNIVQGAWSGIKTAVKATSDFITGTVWPGLKAAWDGVAKGAMWLWRNGIEPAWNGIKAAVGVVVFAVKAYMAVMTAQFRVVAAVATWLWRNVFAPVFAGIGKAVEIWWLAVQIVFKLFTNVVRNTVGRVVTWLYDTVIRPYFNLMRVAVGLWWSGVKASFGFFAQYIGGPLRSALTAMKNFFTGIFNTVKVTVAGWWSNGIRPVFNSFAVGWRAVGSALSSTYNNAIKPIFEKFVGFIRTTVVGGFNTGVAAIGKAWDRVKEIARKPVAFVVNQIINPFINGLNKVAGAVGVKDRVQPIGGFAEGGHVVPGYANGGMAGGKITGPPSSVDNKLAPARIPGVGAVKLAGGEYVVNAHDTPKALPLLNWINGGMKKGSRRVAAMLGKPVADMPGDGSEGWAFADGGLVGWAKDVWGAISDPIGAVKKPFETLLGRIPGSGMIKDFLVGSAKKVLDGAVKWLGGFGGLGDGTFAYHGSRAGRIGAAANFIRAQAGKPYVWNSAGPGGYDCSGAVSAVWNVLKGRDPYSHTFSTGSLPGDFFKPGTAGPLVAGWSHPGQSPAGASVGHMAGNIAGLPFESRGSKGVVVGSQARSVRQFAHLGAAGLARGGSVPVFDTGGTLSPGFNTVYNGLGRPEPLVRSDKAGVRNYNITVNVASGGHPAEAGRQVVLAIQAYERGNGSGWRKGP
jgi:TP901 family phage tail tape measure protein